MRKSFETMSTSVAPVISFHDYVLFDVYRQQLEHVNHIGIVAKPNTGPVITTPVLVVNPSTSPVIIPPVVIHQPSARKEVTFLPQLAKVEEIDDDLGDTIDDLEMDAIISFDSSHWVVDKAIEEKQEKHINWLEQQQKEQQQQQSKQELYAKEYALIKQLETNEKEPCLYDYTTEDIIVSASAHCDWLLENDIHVEVMNNTNRLLRRNVEFELLCQDKRSVKIVSLHDRFMELALREDVSEEELTALIAQTHEIAQIPEKDALLLKCLEQKKRGRTSDADRLKTVNIVDALRKESISPKKPVTGDSNNTTTNQEIVLTDKYRVFLSLLKLVHENAQTKDNYGAYLEKINRLVGMDSTKVDWPMQTLMKSILNMEACLGINEIESIDITPEEVYYCSYSGDLIKRGDNVYHIRILEYSHERHKKWRINKNRPNREFESPEFMESVRAFFVKKHFISLTGLWYRDFDEVYKALHSEKHQNMHNKIMNNKKKKQRTTLKQEVSRISVKKDGHLWQRMTYMRDFINEHNLDNKEVNGKTFNSETQRINTLLANITDTHSLQVGLCDIISAYYKGDDDDNKMAFVNRLMFVILNFIDVFYHVDACHDDTYRPLTVFDTKDCTLRLLLDISYQRRNHSSYNIIGNEFEKIDKYMSDVNKYDEFSDNNFLFLSIFDYLFPNTVIKKESGISEVLHIFGL